MADFTLIPHRLLERRSAVTPLGFRFWDPVSDRQVRDGLTVIARPAAAHHTATHAFRTRSGLYAFQGLPGLHRIEHPSRNDVGPASPPVALPFIIEVYDEQGRFFPLILDVVLPLPDSSLYSATPSSPPSNGVPKAYLFSALTRTAAPGWAMVRGQLLEQPAMRPAVHALVEVQVQSTTWYGVTDPQGSVAVFFPYPTARIPLGPSPPEAQRISLYEQHWPVTIRVRYDPAALIYPRHAETPLLRSISNQSAGLILQTLAGPATMEMDAELQFGQELKLRTDQSSTLLISRVGAP